jgi:K+-transporting ATPase ATPase A chain
MTRVSTAIARWLSPVLGPIERGALSPRRNRREGRGTELDRLCGRLLFFNLAGFAALYFLQRFQAQLPFNPAGMGEVGPELAFNTAIQLRHQHQLAELWRRKHHVLPDQMLGLTVQNFLSAATGIALAMAVIRGFLARRGQDARQFLGRSRARDALRAAADLHRLSLVLVAGRAADLAPIRRR